MTNMIYLVLRLILLRLISTVSLTIENGGFELDTMPNGDPIPEQTFVYGEPVITGWIPYPNTTIDWCIGVSNPTNSGAFINGSGAIEGNLTAYIWSGDPGEGELGIVQYLSHNITSDTQYTLTVSVGDPASASWSAQSTGGASNEESTGFPGYRIDLLAGNNILATDNNTLSLSDGYWNESILKVDVRGTFNPFVGETLAIRLINLNQGPGKEVLFDWVRLDATPIIYHSFTIISVQKNWADAELYCINTCGTHLASIHSQEDWDTARNLAINYWDNEAGAIARDMFIGLYDALHNDIWYYLQISKHTHFYLFLNNKTNIRSEYFKRF